MHEFSDNKFVEAVQRLRDTQEQNLHHNKRRANRMDVRVLVQVKAGDDNSHMPWTTTQLRDVSPFGALLTIDERMETGSSLLLRLPSTEREEALPPLICRVAHCKKHTDELFLIGVEFVGHLESTQTSATPAAEHARTQQSSMN